MTEVLSWTTLNVYIKNRPWIRHTHNGSLLHQAAEVIRIHFQKEAFFIFLQDVSKEENSRGSGKIINTRVNRKILINRSKYNCTSLNASVKGLA